MQFTYEQSRQAINFYIRHADRLQDVSPARIVMIADVFKNTPNRMQREMDLEVMLASSPASEALLRAVISPGARLASTEANPLVETQTAKSPQAAPHRAIDGTNQSTYGSGAPATSCSTGGRAG